MKIRIIGSAHPLRGGGISTLNERLATVLQDEGHDVEIWSFSLQYPSILFPGKSQRTTEPAPEGLRIRSVINSVNPLNWLSIGRRLRADHADLIIVRFWTPFMGPAFGTLLRSVRKAGHTRIVAIADNVVAHEKKAVDRMFTEYFFKPIHGFVTMSGEVMQDLRKLTQKPAVKLFHPLYDNYGPAMERAEALQQLKLDPSNRYALFFGFIRNYKGLDMLLDAMAESSVAAAGIHLIVAGEYYSDRELIEGLIRNHNLASRVHLFTSFIPNDEVRRYFAAADTVVLPYRSATQSGIILTAYHFNRSVIVTRVGGLPEYVDEGATGLVCEPDPASIAASLVQYFEAGIADLPENLELAKVKYSWPVFTEKLLAFTETIRP